MRRPAAHLCRHSLPLDAGSRLRLSGMTLKVGIPFPGPKAVERISFVTPRLTRGPASRAASRFRAGCRIALRLVRHDTQVNFPFPVYPPPLRSGKDDRWRQGLSDCSIFATFNRNQSTTPRLSFASITQIDSFISLGLKIDSAGQLHGVLRECAGLADIQQY